MPPPFPISNVRYLGLSSEGPLAAYVKAGRMGPSRVPRGLDSDCIRYWMRTHVNGSLPPVSYSRCRQVLAYYELGDLTSHFVRLLNPKAEKSRDHLRNVEIVELAGAVGGEAEVRLAGQFFQRVLVAHPQAVTNAEQLLPAAIALAPVMDLRPLAARLAAAQPEDEAAAEKRDEQLETALPEAQEEIALRNRIAGRLPELAAEYLEHGESLETDTPVWAGRRLRKMALQGEAGHAAVLTTLGRVLEQTGDEATFQRAARAVLYMKGKLSFAQIGRLERIPFDGDDFLWDEDSRPK
ncbi:MAG: hypothetical protein JNM66_31010 [Bryobacterales bacterium]|nr:hypothetical protein [Bryobacterales bacterium]